MTAPTSAITADLLGDKSLGALPRGAEDCRSVATYTFGDDVPAVKRLALVASAYEPASRSFVGEHGTHHADLTLDLGCGPGFSTRLVSETLAPKRLVGVDSSPDFLDVAKANVPSATFVVHDLTTRPLPVAGDVVYARLVLAHLPEPLATVMAWRDLLRPNGVLLIEDLEAVEAPEGPLRAYEDLSAAVVRSGGGLMYAGAALAPLGGRCTAVTVPSALAAAIYLINVRRWLEQGPPGVSRDEVGEVEAGLATVADDGAGTVSWIVRQLALRS